MPQERIPIEILSIASFWKDLHPNSTELPKRLCDHYSWLKSNAIKTSEGSFLCKPYCLATFYYIRIKKLGKDHLCSPFYIPRCKTDNIICQNWLDHFKIHVYEPSQCVVTFWKSVRKLMLFLFGLSPRLTLSDVSK